MSSFVSRRLGVVDVDLKCKALLIGRLFCLLDSDHPDCAWKEMYNIMSIDRWVSTITIVLIVMCPRRFIVTSSVFFASLVLTFPVLDHLRPFIQINLKIVLLPFVPAAKLCGINDLALVWSGSRSGKTLHPVGMIPFCVTLIGVVFIVFCP